MEILNFINGKWVPSSQTHPIAWASGRTSQDSLCTLNHQNSEDRALAEAALEGARLSHQQILAGEIFPLPRRLQLLQTVQQLLSTERNELATLIAEEVAKPLSLAHAEIDRALLTLEATLQAAETMLGLQPLTQTLRHAPIKSTSIYELRKPLGPVFCITPFNFPLNLIMHKIAPALVSGAPVVLKVAPKASRVGAHLVQTFEKANAPAGMLNLIHCDNELTSEICSDPRIAHVSFTGSDIVGWQLKKKINVGCTLELGGNAAAYIHKDASLKKAAKQLTMSAFGFAGQSCISLQNLFIHKDVYDNFRALMIQNLHQLKWGEPLLNDTACSWVIEENAAKKIKARIKNACEKGATIAAQAEPPSGWTWSQLSTHPTAVAPTLLENVDLTDPISSEEIFGPILNLHRVESEFDFYQWLKSTPYRLQTSLWSADIETHLNKLTTMDFGGVLINESPSFRFDPACYGGRGKSGIGVEGPKHVIAALTHVTSVVIGH